MPSPSCFGSEEQLFGILEESEDREEVVLFLHGFGGSHLGPHYSYANLSDRLKEEGYSSLRFDFYGSGNSEGDFFDQNIYTMLEDAEEAIEYLEEEKEFRTMHLVGHSRGGNVAMMLSEERNFESITTWATVYDYSDLWTKTSLEASRENDAITTYGFRYPVDSLRELDEMEFGDLMSEIEEPTLIAHGWKDFLVPFNHAEDLYEKANEPKELLGLKYSNHIFSHPRDRSELLGKTLSWIKQH